MAMKVGLHGTEYDDAEPLLCTDVTGRVWNRITHVEYDSVEDLTAYAIEIGQTLEAGEIGAPSLAWRNANTVQNMEFGVYTP